MTTLGNYNVEQRRPWRRDEKTPIKVDKAQNCCVGFLASAGQYAKWIKWRTRVGVVCGFWVIVFCFSSRLRIAVTLYLASSRFIFVALATTWPWKKNVRFIQISFRRSNFVSSGQSCLHSDEQLCDSENKTFLHTFRYHFSTSCDFAKKVLRQLSDFFLVQKRRVNFNHSLNKLLEWMSL